MSSSRPSSIRQTKSPPVTQPVRSPHSPPPPGLELHPPTLDEPQDQDPPFDPEADDENDVPYPEPSSEQTLLPPPNFNPFFTLIEDTTSGEHYHPCVHYVFTDDDPVIVTAASMRSLGLDDTQFLPQNTPDGEDDSQRQDGEHGDGEQGLPHETHVESPLPPPIPGVKERYIIVDVAADGHSIEDAQSLCSDWQITNTSVRTAPSFDEESPDQGYMLRIEGVEIPAKSKGKGKGEPGEAKLKEAKEKAQGDAFTALDELIKGIEGGLEVAGKISGTREDVRESDRTVLPRSMEADEKSKGRAAETCDF